MKVEYRSSANPSLMALGASTGFFLGVVLGVIISLILERASFALSAIVILHTAVAMAFMGGWTVPCMVPEDQGPR